MRIVVLALTLMVAALPSGCSRPETEETSAMQIEETAPLRVWLDVDTATGLPRSEVDDGLALIQAFHSPELEVRGVSVVYGNTSLEKAVPVAETITARFGPPGVAVHPGAASAEELGRESAAVRAMAAALAETPLTILALGPVTNVATLLELHPELQGRIERLVMVAARRPGQRFYPRRPDGTVPEPPPGAAHRDFNFELDPAAMAIVLASEVPLVFAPWEVSSWVWIRRADLDHLAVTGESGAYVAEACRSWVELWRERFGVDGFNPFDTLAVGYLTSPELFETRNVAVWIEQGPDDRQPPGSGVVKPYLLIDAERSGGRRALYCVRPRAEFKRQLLERLGGETRRS